MTNTHKIWFGIGSVIIIFLLVAQCAVPKERAERKPFAHWSAEQWRLLKKVDFEGEWTPGDRCSAEHNFCRFVFTNNRTYTIDRPGNIVCFWPTEDPLQVRVRKQDGSWTGFRDYPTNLNSQSDAIEIRSPKASRDYPYVAYVAVLPNDKVEFCTNSKILRALWEVT